jgi:hypothetical protein
MKKASTLVFLLAWLICLAAAEPILQVGTCSPQTIELVPEASMGVVDFELYPGDRVEGSFSFSNLGPYVSKFDGQLQFVGVEVSIDGPEWTNIIKFEDTTGDSFNFTASTWGVYRLWAFCGATWHLENPKTPQIILDYEIIPAKVPENAAPDMVGWWKLDEGNGTIAHDSSFHNRQGDISGAAWTAENGTNILDFNGVEDYVALSPLPLSSLEAFTVSAWINSNFTKPGFIIYNGYKGEFQFGNGNLTIGTQENNFDYISFCVSLSDAHWYGVSSFKLTPNSWHHVVGVWNNSGSLKIYVDGFLAGENNNLPALNLYECDGSFLASLGIYSQGLYEKEGFFKGQMSNVIVYNKALSVQEIGNLTVQGAASIGIPVPTMQVTNQASTNYTIVIVAVVLVIVIIGGLTIFIQRKH